MNICEIGLFHIVFGVYKGTVIIIMIFGENNVFGPKYIDIYEFQGVWGGRTHSTIHFLFIIKKNGKSIKAMTDTKIKFYIILISNLFS